MQKHEHPVVLVLQNQINYLKERANDIDLTIADLPETAGDYERGLLEGESLCTSIMLTKTTNELTAFLFSE